MKTLRKEKIQPIYVEFIPEFLEYGKIYISKEYSTSTHLCLCGCGEKCVLPLTESEWILEDFQGIITLKPSILQRFNCKSHYIITNGIANFI